MKRGLCGLFRVNGWCFRSAGSRFRDDDDDDGVSFLAARPNAGRNGGRLTCMVKRGLCGLLRVTRGAFARQEARFRDDDGFLFWHRI